MQYKLLLFIISPLISLVYSIRNFSNKGSRILLWLFIGFYGYTFTTFSSALDAARIKEKFLRSNEFSFYQYTGIDKVLSTGNIEIVEPALLWMTRHVTTDFQILMMLYGLIFGFFLVRNTYLIYEQIDHTKKNKLVVLLVVAFAFTISFWEINGWRFWTASQIFVWIVLNRYIRKKPKDIYLIILPFIHYSFILAIVLYFLSLLSKYISYKVLVLLLLTSFSISNINVDAPLFFSNFKSKVIPIEYGKEQLEAYSNIDFIKDRQRQSVKNNFYVVLYKKFLQLSVILLLTLSLFVYKKHFKGCDFLPFAVLYLALGLLFSKIGVSNLGRFIEPALMIAIAALIPTINIIRFKIKNWYLYRSVVSLMLFFYLLVEFRVGLDRIGYYSFLTNPILAPLLDPDGNVAVIIWIKSLL